MNRAIARRPLFENDRDIRYFLACTARAVRRGQLEVHAWCVLTTHFHMLVRSPTGELSDAMRRIQNEYVRHFNRTRRRDGSLLRGRFRSKPVDSVRYRQVLVRYIDANAVEAGLATDPCEYRWCSARQYVSGSGPRWLSRGWVERWAANQAGADRYDPSVYPRALEARQQARIASLVSARLHTESEIDDLDSLLAMASPEKLAWLRRKATLADGEPASQPHVPASSVSDVVATFAARHGHWPLASGRPTIDGWSVLHAGLLRDLAASSFVSLAQRMGISHTHARRLVERHRNLLTCCGDYGCIAARAAREILHDAFDLVCPAPGPVE